MKPPHIRILDAGVSLWPNVTPSTVARALGLNSHTNVLYYFKNGDTLKDEVAKHAVATGNSKVIVQLLAIGHKAVKLMSAADRIRHFNAVK